MSPQIVDVLVSYHFGDKSRPHYHVIVGEPVHYVYSRGPGNYFIGQCGDFFDFLAGTARKGEAFGGREFDIDLDDGTKFHCQGDVWSCCAPKGFEPVVNIGCKSMEELRECYVFYNGNVRKSVLDAWLAANTPKEDYRHYDPHEHWRRRMAPVFKRIDRLSRGSPRQQARAKRMREVALGPGYMDLAVRAGTWGGGASKVKP